MLVARVSGEIVALLRVISEVVKLDGICGTIDELILRSADHEEGRYRALTHILATNDVTACAAL